MTDYDVSVNLSAKQAPGAPVAAPMQIFEIDDAAEQPHISWTNRNELKLELNDEGTVSVCKHEVADIKIKYVVPKWMWDSLGAIESDHVRDDRQSEELFKAGKMSQDDLRVSLQTIQAVAEERATFRQWVLDNATVDVDAVANGQPTKR